MDAAARNGLPDSAPNYRFDLSSQRFCQPPWFSCHNSAVPYLEYSRASLKSMREREQVSLSSIPSSRGWFTKASLQNTVDRSEADPSSWRRILLRSSMDFVPVETLFNLQGAVMSVSLIVRIIVSLLPLNSHDCGSLPFLNHCIVIHSF